ncbi:unnamed protein product [Leptosia nina]|uniref:Uncharacterized protein n=1 Tax=Leptosia nina TaxID=320188 RepID=A0AAV1J0A1_9NEOP
MCIVALAAVCGAFAAPEGKRDKRGFLHGDVHHSLDLHSYDSFDHFHGPILHSAPAARIVSVNKVVEVPRVVEVKKLVSVPKVVSVPQIVKVSKIVEEPHYSLGSSYSSGWW